MGTIFHRLFSTCKMCALECQTSFRPGWGYIDQTFILQQIVGHKGVYGRPMTFLSLELKTSLDWFDDLVLWCAREIHSYFPKPSLCLWLSFVWVHRGKWGSSGQILPPFRINLLTQTIREIVLSLFEKSSADICSKTKQFDYKYTDGVVPLSENPSELQVSSIIWTTV